MFLFSLVFVKYIICYVKLDKIISVLKLLHIVLLMQETADFTTS